MEPGPVPPHERAWRHPSELGPPAHEPSHASARALIITSVAIGLVACGVLAVAMTPNRSASPLAVASTARSSRPDVAAASITPDLTTRATATSAFGSGASSAAAEPATVVTPIGDGTMAITTLAGVTQMGATLVARLPGGQSVEIVVVRTDAATGLALVALPDRETDGGYRMADETPAPNDTVVVHGVRGVETMVVRMIELVDLDVTEGAPVVDADGDLVGLCSADGDDTALLSLVDPDRPTTVVSTPTTVETDDSIASTTDAMTATTVATVETTVTSTDTTTPTSPTSSVDLGG